MRMLEGYGDDRHDQAKGDQLARKLTAANAKLAADDSLIHKIELDPARALAELEISGDAARTFRILPGVTTRDSCYCNCYFTACGTGVGCFNSDGHGSASSGC